MRWHTLLITNAAADRRTNKQSQAHLRWKVCKADACQAEACELRGAAERRPALQPAAEKVQAAQVGQAVECGLHCGWHAASWEAGLLADERHMLQMLHLLDGRRHVNAAPLLPCRALAGACAGIRVHTEQRQPLQRWRRSYKRFHTED